MGVSHDKLQKCVPLSKQKEFTQIKNAIIREAERLRLDEITFEEKNLNQQDEPEEFQNASYDYWTLRDIIRDESLTIPWQEIETIGTDAILVHTAVPKAPVAPHGFWQQLRAKLGL